VSDPYREISKNVASATEEAGDEIYSQPVVPYASMVFDDLEEAKKFYNDHAFKSGFGIRIGNTTHITICNAMKDTILNRVFGCVHTGKSAIEAQGPSRKKKHIATNDLNGTIDMCNFTTEKSRNILKGLQMDMKDTRQQLMLLQYDCNAHMLAGKRKVHGKLLFSKRNIHTLW
jgi:hypothetical protein